MTRARAKPSGLTQIDVGKMTNFLAKWLSTNAYCNSKFGSTLPFNIIYVADFRTGSGCDFMPCG